MGEVAASNNYSHGVGRPPLLAQDEVAVLILDSVLHAGVRSISFRTYGGVSLGLVP